MSFKSLVVAYQRARGVIHTLFVGILVCVLGYIAWQWGRQGLAEQIYRERLGQLNEEYVELQKRYAEVLKRTAITELEVTESAVAVVLRSDAGELERFTTSLNPQKEIFIDYLVLEGRLWIRRIFDSSMAPQDAILIEPSLAGIDWEAKEHAYGKAVYRQLSPGRWQVSVTGNGALGLAKVDVEGEQRVLSAVSVEIREDSWEAEAMESIDEITWQDAARWTVEHIPDLWN